MPRSSEAREQIIEQNNQQICRDCYSVINKNNSSVYLLNKKPPLCIYCYRKRRNEINIHRRMIQKDQNAIACKRCGRRFSKRGELTCHMTRHNLSDGKQICKDCGVELTQENRLNKTRSHNGLICKICSNKRSRKYAEKYGEKGAFNRQLRINARKAVLGHYGHKCVCCGIFEDVFLAVDHINGGGTKHKKLNKISSMSLWLVKNNFPEGFQILCHNCNYAKYRLGQCPHQTKRQQVASPIQDTSHVEIKSTSHIGDSPK